MTDINCQSRAMRVVSVWNPLQVSISDAPDDWLTRDIPKELSVTPDGLGLPSKVVEIIQWSLLRSGDVPKHHRQTMLQQKRHSILGRSRSLRAKNIFSTLRDEDHGPSGPSAASNHDAAPLREVLQKLSEHQSSQLDDRHEWEEEVMIEEYGKGQKNLAVKQDELRNSVEQFITWKKEEVNAEFQEAQKMADEKYEDERQSLLDRLSHLPGYMDGEQSPKLDAEYALTTSSLQKDHDAIIASIDKAAQAEFHWLGSMASRRKDRLDTERHTLVAQINEQVLIDKTWFEVVWNRRWAMLDAHTQQILQADRDGRQSPGLTSEMAEKIQPFEPMASSRLSPTLDSHIEESAAIEIAELPAELPASFESRSVHSAGPDPLGTAAQGRVSRVESRTASVTTNGPLAASHPDNDTSSIAETLPDPGTGITREDIEKLIQKYMSNINKDDIISRAPLSQKSETTAPSTISSTGGSNFDIPAHQGHGKGSTDSTISFVTINTVATSIMASPIDLVANWETKVPPPLPSAPLPLTIPKPWMPPPRSNSLPEQHADSNPQPPTKPMCAFPRNATDNPPPFHPPRYHLHPAQDLSQGPTPRMREVPPLRYLMNERARSPPHDVRLRKGPLRHFDHPGYRIQGGGYQRRRPATTDPPGPLSYAHPPRDPQSTSMPAREPQRNPPPLREPPEPPAPTTERAQVAYAPRSDHSDGSLSPATLAPEPDTASSGPLELSESVTPKPDVLPTTAAVSHSFLFAQTPLAHTSEWPKAASLRSEQSPQPPPPSPQGPLPTLPAPSAEEEEIDRRITMASASSGDSAGKDSVKKGSGRKWRLLSRQRAAE